MFRIGLPAKSVAILACLAMLLLFCILDAFIKRLLVRCPTYVSHWTAVWTFGTLCEDCGPFKIKTSACTIHVFNIPRHVLASPLTNILPLFPFRSYVIMINFASQTLGKPFSLVNGRVLLAVADVVVILFAVAGGYGLAIYMGVVFSSVALVSFVL
jgi:hypothetical protein